MKHTDGPWEVSETHDARERLIIMPHPRKPGKRMTGATVYGFTASDADADARLIAAAPELLAAMKWIVQEIEWNHDMTGALAVAKLAIEKATGQEPPCTS